MLAACAAGSPVCAVRADDVIAPDPTAESVTAYGGLVAWTREDENHRFRLVLYANGLASDVPVPPSGHDLFASLGPGADGHPTLVYTRRQGRTSTLERLDTVTGIESPAAAPRAVGRLCDIIGAVNGRLLAYSLTAEGLPSRCKQMVRVVDDRGRTLISRRAIAPGAPVVNQSAVAFAAGDVDIALRVVRLRTHRSFVVARNENGAILYTLAAGWLYHSAWAILDTGPLEFGTFRARPHRPLACAETRPYPWGDGLLNSFAVDPPDVYYIVTHDPYGEGGGPVHHIPLASLSFGRSSRKLC